MLYNERHFSACPPPSGLASATRFEIPQGTPLYRFGHLMGRDGQNRHRCGHGGSQLAAYASPWWVTESVMNKILNEKVGDAAQVGRVMLAIHPAWKGDMFFLVKGVTKHRYVAWRGIGDSFDKDGNVVPRTSKKAVWIPPTSIDQLYIPGLDGMPVNGVPRFDPGPPSLYWREPVPMVVSASAYGGVTATGISPSQYSDDTLPKGRKKTNDIPWNKQEY